MLTVIACTRCCVTPKTWSPMPIRVLSTHGDRTKPRCSQSSHVACMLGMATTCLRFVIRSALWKHMPGAVMQRVRIFRWTLRRYLQNAWTIPSCECSKGGSRSAARQMLVAHISHS